MTHQGQQFIPKHPWFFGIHLHSWKKDQCVLGKSFLTRHPDYVLENYWAVGIDKVMVLILIENASCGLVTNDVATIGWKSGGELELVLNQ